MQLPIQISLMKVAKAAYIPLIEHRLAFQVAGENLYYDDYTNSNCIIGACLTDEEADFLDFYKLNGKEFNTNNSLDQLYKDGIVAIPFEELKTLIYLQDLHDSCFNQDMAKIWSVTETMKRILQEVLLDEYDFNITRHPLYEAVTEKEYA